MRWAPLVLMTVLGAGCTDLREFRGEWIGHRVGNNTEALHTGIAGDLARLTIDRIDGHSFAAQLQVDQLLTPTPIQSIAGAEADVLSGLTFSGDPLKVYLSFVPIPDNRGEALIVLALFDDHRIEVRLLRGGGNPLYGIWALGAASGTAP
ncbi:MAG TPA: hypothetical protein VFP84_21775 [Kofleriaceae bacterium]|nr:hypothetical protein [Kofleriaceae bacterium]